MLTADLVDARKKDGELILRPLDADGRASALSLAAAFLDAAHDLVGRPREEIDEAWSAAAEADAKRFKLALGLKKLVLDGCVFEAETDIDPAELRRVLFTEASRYRRETEVFDRAGALARASAVLGIPAEAIEAGIFSDLKSEHVLREAPKLTPASVVEAWELGQAQAVLLTAVKVTCEVESSSAGLVRAFFAKLKFHKLLFAAEKTDRGWRIEIDGPYSMFDAVTKYGVRLAMAYPSLRVLEKWSLHAEIRWGKTREKLTFRAASTGTTTVEPRGSSERGQAPHLSDDVRELLEGIEGLDAGWKVKPASQVLDIPGLGVCIPDLELSRKGDKKPIFVEVLGYWSRDAVWKRVELAEKGLGAKIVFAVSSRLRVSAEVLESDAACLYVYKGKMSPRAVLDHALQLRAAKK